MQQRFGDEPTMAQSPSIVASNLDQKQGQDVMMRAQKADKNTRKCLVTGEAKQKSELIRFVRSPENIVTADLSGKLPGRGVWVTAEREILLKAGDHRVFMRGFKDKSVRLVADASIPSQSMDFVDRVVKLQYGRVMKALGLCRRSGELVTGFDKVYDALKVSKKDDLLIFAHDAGRDGVGKLQNLATLREILTIDEFDRETLSKATGFDAIGYLFVPCSFTRKTGGQPGRNVRKEILRYQSIKGDSDVSPK